jgi:general secretion pathway protein G
MGIFYWYTIGMYLIHSRTVKGFTLVELLVVIAIIGILMAIVTTSFSGAKQKARDSKRVADLKNIQLALALYYNDNGMYPKNIYAAAGTVPDSGLAPAYLPTVPRDPKATGSEACSGSGANSIPGCYHYNAFTSVLSGICNTTNTPVLYHLGATFEDDTNTILTQDLDANQTLSNIYTSPTYYACASSPSAFHGNAALCSGTTAAATDACYDLTP